MQPHISSQADKATLELLKGIRAYVEEIPEHIELKSGQLVKFTSHNLVQALAHQFRLQAVHGYFDSACEHAWLQTPNPDFIIDPYPPLVLGGPVLVYVSTAAMSPWCRIYDSERRPTALDKAGLLDEVNAILEATERKRMFLAIP